MKLLAYMETPFIETGSGQVSKRLLPMLHEFFSEIHIVAINQFQEPAILPDWLTITCTSGEDHAATEESRAAIKQGDYDAIFLSTDLNRVAAFEKELEGVTCPIVMYALMDTHVWQSQFWQILKRATVPVLPSHWAVRQALILQPSLKEKLQAIYHGCEPEVFYPLPEEERRKARKEFFGITDDRFLALNVNRNQVRKDLPRTMAAFHLFHLEHPDSSLYLHSRRADLGGDLTVQASFLGVDIFKQPAEIIFAPDGYYAAAGLARSDLNRVYNCADVFMTTARGEGWGLTTTEAMAAGVPVIGPDNTVFPEILGAGAGDSAADPNGYCFGKRGILVKSGGPDLWAVDFTISDVPREIVSTTGMKNALEEVYFQWRDTAKDTEAARFWAKKQTNAARAWTKEHTWSHKLEEWRKVWKTALCLPSETALSSGTPDTAHSDTTGAITASV